MNLKRNTTTLTCLVLKKASATSIKPSVRDKDAIQAVLIVAEIAAYYRSRGMTLADGIEEIYKQYGYFAEKTISVTSFRC